MTQNIACRIFKEQIKLINQLPEKERPIVLYLAINHSFNQFENQNGNQIDIQNENAYVSVSESLYLNQLSDISKCLLELLKKNIVCKEFSNNYGGRRDGSGRPKINQVENHLDIQVEKKNNENKIFIGEDFNFGDCESVRDIANKFDLYVLDSLQRFLVTKMVGRWVDINWIEKQAERFANGN